MAMQMQATLLGSPTNHVVGGGRMTHVGFPLGFTSRVGKRVELGVRCMSNEENKDGKSEPTVGSPSTSTPNPSTSSPVTPKPFPKKVSTSFRDVFAFSGPAPERINGRLAMIGFVAAIAVEASNGLDLFSQISDGGAQWFLGTSILLSIASLVPLFKGERAEFKKDGIMNADAELWNGRLAMLGLVALAFTEYVTGSALV